MLTMIGRSPLSQLAPLRLVAGLPGVREVRAHSVYLVLADPHPSGEAQAALEELLDASTRSSPVAATGAEEGFRFWVAPRRGTVSAWASKATEIAQRCGFAWVTSLERAVRYVAVCEPGVKEDELHRLEARLHDPMVQSVYSSEMDLAARFHAEAPRPLGRIPLGSQGRAALLAADASLGLALDAAEVDYLAEAYAELGRDPTDAELMMFAQANSEHCRHKIFKARFFVDGEEQARSLFDMIVNTFEQSPGGVLSAYRDNAAVMRGPVASVLLRDPATGLYREEEEHSHILMKCETHNHPTAISPFPGAATGSGGEIRDETATGRGAEPKAGVVGFAVSNLRIPGFVQSWEGEEYGRPSSVSTPLRIMLDGPLGAAAFNNEFGRPGVMGFFRVFEQERDGAQEQGRHGYHKPIMLAGGLGNVRPPLVRKARVSPGDVLVVLGGPAFLIGLGGGAASSRAQGAQKAALDFASVQRDNPEMQRRCQEVISACNALGPDSPIVSVHDVGAGGLSNALPELVWDHELGANLELRRVPSGDPALSPLELWCNEAQERFVLAVSPEQFEQFERIAARERCPMARLGVARAEHHLRVTDEQQEDRPIDLPMSLLFGNVPRLERDAWRRPAEGRPLNLDSVTVDSAALRVLALPTVADKTFLVTIGDRSVGGKVCRDSMVGPWQVPVADAAITLSDYRGYAGEGLALGERFPVALLDAARSARLAVGEAITNLACTPVGALSNVCLSANWMAAAGEPGQDADLFDAVRAVGMELCPKLGIAIPVGKDSLSMRAAWRDASGQERRVVSPLSLVVTAFAPLADVRRHVTPQLSDEPGARLWLLDLGAGADRLGGSALAQVYGQLGDEAPDLDEPERLVAFFALVQGLLQEGALLAYHDRSDGGLWVTLCEMAFAAHRGLDLDLDPDAGSALAALFSEELGAVVQVSEREATRLTRATGVRAVPLGRLRQDDRIVVRHRGQPLVDRPRTELQRAWSETSYRMQVLRDCPQGATSGFDRILDANYPGLSARMPSGFRATSAAAHARRGDAKGAMPTIAVLREQGVNGHREMAAAFMAAGFRCRDVHMTDLESGAVSLAGFSIFVACGGFSYGDVLGAGQGWAKSILHTPRLRAAFRDFFHRPDTLSLGVCNGCQMLSGLSELIPGAEHFPRFVLNASQRFESRLSLVRIDRSPSVFLNGLAGAQLPVVVAHGEGRARFEFGQGQQAAARQAVALRYVDHHGAITERYPENPNGSPAGVAGVTSADGRVTAMMPHPERALRRVQLSYCPAGIEGPLTPWSKMFENAMSWLS